MGEKTPITSAMLDANRLAVLTNSNPVFSVLRKPRYGKIRKIIPSSNRVKRQAKEKDTSTFTYEDIQNEFIFYVLRKSDLNESTFDSCEYLLTAPNVQPAVGQLDFMILPTASLVAASKSSIDATANQTNGTTNINRKGMTNDGQPLPDIISENTLTGLGISSDVVLIVGIVCAVLVLGLLVLVVVRFVYIIYFAFFFPNSFIKVEHVSRCTRQMSRQAAIAKECQKARIAQPRAHRRHATLSPVRHY